MTVDHVDDAADFKEVCESLLTVGATQQQLDSMLELIAGILHLGNVEFETDSDDNAHIKASSSKSIELAMKFLQCSILKEKVSDRSERALRKTRI